MLSISEKDKSLIYSILDCIVKIKRYSKDSGSGANLYSNYQAFDATVMNFIVIGEMVSKLSEDFLMHHDQIDWINIIGFRNIIAHDYFGIDADELWDIIQTDLKELEEFLNSIKD